MTPSDQEAALRRYLQDLLQTDLPPGQPMPGGGSTRLYHRYAVPESTPAGGIIGVVGQDKAEMARYLRFTRYFAQRGVPVPRLLGANEQAGLYAVEDLGPHTLAQRLAAWERPDGGEGMTPQGLAALESAVAWLPRIQVMGRPLLAEMGHATGALDGHAFMGDVETFLDWYVTHRAPALKPSAAVLDDLRTLARTLDSLPRDLFCYRDFQARNIMWPNAERGVVFLDYQDALWGPAAYDLASLLYSPDSRLDDAGRERLIGVYVRAAEEAGLETEGAAVRHALYPIVLLRRMQALGAYVRITVQLGKPGYLEKIPPALATLRGLQAKGRFAFGLPALEAWLQTLLRD